MAAESRFVVNTCECCGAPVGSWLPGAVTDSLPHLKPCRECGVSMCLACRGDHWRGRHGPCDRARSPTP